MGSYVSRSKEVVEEYPPRTPVGAIYRAILENKDKDFESLLHNFSSESLVNDYGETPLEYLLQLSLNQSRFNMMCCLLQKNYGCGTTENKNSLYGDEGYRILFPLMDSRNILAVVYITRLLSELQDIPDGAYHTSSENVYRLFCEYGMSAKISYVPHDEEEVEKEVEEIFPSEEEVHLDEGQEKESPVEYHVVSEEEEEEEEFYFESETDDEIVLHLDDDSPGVSPDDSPDEEESY